MTVVAESTRAAEGQHLVLNDVSWDFYERVLEEIGDRPIRVTFDEASIEIMSPLPRHEKAKKNIARLLELMALELNVPLEPFGSSTFRCKDRQKGVEPDECYYIAAADVVRDMEEFDSKLHPPPDLAIEVEVDVTHRSIPRQPIYAALGVPELWRYDGREIQVLRLGPGDKYERQSTSIAFPFPPMTEFEGFVKRMEVEAKTQVLREYQKWVRSLPR